jgi:hypothetical protein
MAKKPSATASKKPAAAKAAPKARVAAAEVKKSAAPDKTAAPKKAAKANPGAKSAPAAGSSAAAEAPPPAPAPPPCAVRIKYNHYNEVRCTQQPRSSTRSRAPATECRSKIVCRCAAQEFSAAGGRLSWEAIDEEFCISFAFRGNFERRLRAPDGTAVEAGADGCFGELRDGCTYELDVVEDAAAEEAVRPAGGRTVGIARPAESGGPSSASSRLTSELKSLSLDDLRNQTDEYRALKEARDLEDVLFS